jgi:hypothetical protein
MHNNIVDDLSKLLGMSLGLHGLHLLFMIYLPINPLLDLFVKLHRAKALFDISAFSHDLLLGCIGARVQSMSDVAEGLPSLLRHLLNILL